MGNSDLEGGAAKKKKADYEMELLVPNRDACVFLLRHVSTHPLFLPCLLLLLLLRYLRYLRFQCK
jgi:hypothetical protein